MGNLKFGNNAPLALYMGVSGATKAYYGTEVVFGGGSPVDYSTLYTTMEILTGGTINWDSHGGYVSGRYPISYSLNDGEWTTIDKGSINVFAGDIIRFKGAKDYYGNSSGSGYSFTGTTATFNLYGNIMSMFYNDDFSEQTTLKGAYNAYKMFSGTNVLDASNLILPSTTLQSGAYRQMFGNCPLLQTSPRLPATDVSSFCYQSMFAGCSSLTVAPELPATTLVTSCYQYMFQGCSSLTVAPELPATTLSDFCYQQMFNGCASLTAAPALPATTLASYCYQGMFQGCGSLNYVKCLATNKSANNCLSNWLSNVAATGTFEGYSSAGYPSGASGIPEGWTFVEAS